MKVPCVLQDIVSFEAAALFPPTLFQNHASRAMGIVDHILPLGDLFCLFLFLLRSDSVSVSFKYLQFCIVLQYLILL